MTTMTGVRSARAAGGVVTGPETFRFQAANGSTIAVTVVPTGAQGQARRPIDLAREAIGEVAAAQGISQSRRRERNGGAADCDAAFWSWALPDGWKRSSR